MILHGPAQRAEAPDEPDQRIDDYVQQVVDSAPPLSDAPIEAEAAIRALGHASPRREAS